MQCPRTHTKLNHVKVGGVPVYISQACGGVFLEMHALPLFEKSEEKRGEVLVKHLSQFQAPLPDLNIRIRCPVCTDTVMSRRFYSPLHVVEIDECPGCGGIWLDGGELAKLQALMLTDKDKALLRAQMIDTHRPSHLQELPYKYDNWAGCENKLDALLSLARYLTL